MIDPLASLRFAVLCAMTVAGVIYVLLGPAAGVAAMLGTAAGVELQLRFMCRRKQ